MEATEALPRICPADSRRKGWVHVPIALAFEADAVRAVVAFVTFVAESADVARTALVTGRALLTRL